MMNRRTLILLAIPVLIVIMSVLSIYSSTYQKEGQLWQVMYQRQMLWACIGVCFFVCMSHINYRWWWDAAYVISIVTVILLLLVFVLGIIRLGAQRWLRFGGLNLQPSEIAKLAAIIFLSRYYSSKSLSDMGLPVSRYGFMKGFLLPFVCIFVPVIMIVEQPDLGSGLLVLLIFLVMVFLSGVRVKYLAVFFSAVLTGMPLLWHYLREYQKKRILVFLNPDIDPLGAGYTVVQSRIAVGSGGLFGKGWMSGTQSQLHFLPESHTDFIFASFAEEWGFIGCALLLFLYFMLIREALYIASRSRDTFGALLAQGIAGMLFLQVCINIAMNMGLSPVVGVPLPLLSYGGSSMFVTFMSLGILANIGRNNL